MALKRGKRTRGGNLDRDPRDEGALCDKCPLRDHGPPVFGEGNPLAKLAIIGEGPGLNEVRMGRPFIGRSGEALEEILIAAGTTRSVVYIDNATACFPPGGKLDDFIKAAKKQAKDNGVEFHSPVDCCRPRLFRALGIPTCRKCGKYRAGPSALRCFCKDTTWIAPPGGKRPIVALFPVGNAALQSVYGLTGITRWRGSPINLEKDFEVKLVSKEK